MSDSKNIRDELKEFAPDLFRMEKKEGFQVPPRYFDRLGDEVMHRIKKEEETNAVESPSWFENLITSLQSLLQPRLAMGLAAIALLLIGIQQFGFNTTENSDPEFALVSIESVTDEEFESYLAENIFDFEEELLAELAGEIIIDIPGLEEEEDLEGFFQENAGDIDLGSLEELLL